MKKFLVLIAVFAFGTISYAAQQNTGCGLGHMILGKNDSVISQLTITTTNASTTSQAIGITFGLQSLGCSSASFVSADTESFVSGNMESLIRDIAAGQGETIDSLAVLMEVKDVDAFAKRLQANFDVIFPTADVEYSHVADTIATLA
jgi:hypothetical protein